MKTVLLVDDEAPILAAVRRALGYHGVHVLTASTGDEAIRQLIVAGHVDVILVDINLGGECGAEVAADLSRIAPAARVVFMSAHSKETLAEDGIFLGDARFVSKPVALESLEWALSLMPPPLRSGE